MKKLAIIAAVVFGVVIVAPAKAVITETENQILTNFISNTYHEIDYKGEMPEYGVFYMGMIGYLNLKSKGELSNKGLLTIIDFTISSNNKRIWVIDLKQKKVIYHDLVAHGRNTGNEFAKKFSNVPNSNSSSIGFYVTGETYVGKNGFSMRLDGKDVGFNDNARRRAVVMHSANYVDPSWTKRYGRIGRSFGCPAIPVEGHRQIIKKLSGKTALFIYYPDKEFDASSKWSQKDSAFYSLMEADFSL